MDCIKKDNGDLYIVSTMLQLFIVRKIISMRGSIESNVIFIDFGDLGEGKLNKILLESDRGFEFNLLRLESGSFGLLKSLLTLMNMECISCDNLYVACINSFVYQFLIDKKICFNTMNTFDDGMANLVCSSVYYIDNQSGVIKTLKKILGVKTNVNNVSDKITFHFTIFPKSKTTNILPVDKCVEVDLLSFNAREENKNKDKKINILLGTVYQEIFFKSNQYEIERKLMSIVEAERIDIYIPHPREENEYVNLLKKLNVKVLITEGLTEDYIINQLALYENVSVYGFYSTTLANLSAVKQISLFCIKNKNPKLIGYGEVLSSLGVKLI